MLTINGDQNYDRLKEVKQFDDSKVGVKGLVDSGLTSIPRFFHHPPETRPTQPTPDSTSAPRTIPVVDFSQPRSTVVDQIRRASSSLGFFQIINHSVPQGALDRMIAGIKDFNEQPTEIKAQHYHREAGRGAAFSTNFDLYQSKAASWRDTLQIRLGPTPPDYDSLPEVCRAAVAEWDPEIRRLGEDLMGLLSEGLGLSKDRLKELSCLDGRVMAAHYYPYCPQPDLTVGLTSHTDPGVLTMVLQNQVSGLQVKYGEDWVDVEPVSGALVINIGDILQIISNEEYKSVEHRVLANPHLDARISIAVFFNPGARENLFGPLPELVSQEKPAVYREFVYADFMGKFFTKELDGKSLTNYYKL
ncbi:1-aminocyclopropane-1-carboxylate oxidase homolog 3-like [Cornus florida]|uniref:1-aminocyclopropane-1-carboxylate oxidase homolog 3-like n=1 Tax=Cornus florida TaxID=4283 RepID=UPI002899DE54|nr:1-aminocyclopropane-1-carboxylate oxidase homolog 3-like [Cornus florida]